SKGIFIDNINGYKDHVHALISMGKDQTIAKVMQNIKGESSFWINKKKKTTLKFEWQDDYWAVSIGMGQLKNLRAYIRNQVRHHGKVAFENEIDVLEKEYGLQRIKD
ncbi:MAG TPA: transposase, partial [Bacteroidales bacterium]|nr:transposase [Bacteroidales bacterium]